MEVSQEQGCGDKANVLVFDTTFFPEGCNEYRRYKCGVDNFYHKLSS